MSSGGTTAWVLGDQLSRSNPALDGADRVLMVESEAKLRSLPFHRQKLHLVLSAMRRFAAELEDDGIEVDLRTAKSLRSGLRAHRRERSPDRLVAQEAKSRAGRDLLEGCDVETVRGTLFLTHPDEFAEWAQGRRRLRMEDFYRHQRRRLGVLMDGDEPAGGRWNFDAENRRPPPADRRPPRPYRPREDEIDAEVRRDLDEMGLSAFGEDGPRLWAGSAREAHRALTRFVETRLTDFGPWQDAMLGAEPFMWHSMLSPALNLGLLDPMDCVEAAERAFRDGDAPIESVEGFVRQIIGWREYVWGMYWLEGERWERMNALRADADVPAALWGAETDMRCVSAIVGSLRATGYAHHIERLMVLGNLMLLAGVEPRAATDWFHGSFVDGYEWVMAPNVMGMATWADGGRMMSKPYAAGGRYIDRMSDHCGECRYRPDRRTGEDACPFSSMYWAFLARNRERLADVRRLNMPLRNVDRIDEGELREIRAVASRVRAGDA